MPDFSPANGDTISINGVEYRVSDLSFSDLSVHYFTGVAVRKLGDQHSKSSGYRNGVMTGLGDLSLGDSDPGSDPSLRRRRAAELVDCLARSYALAAHEA